MNFLKFKFEIVTRSKVNVGFLLRKVKMVIFPNLLQALTLRSLLLLSVFIISFEATVAGAGAGETDAKEEVPGVLETKTISRFYDPVEFRGEMLEGLLGKKISHLRLYSFVDGSLRLVPYQFDEWTEDGVLVMDKGPEQNGELANGILDGQDMLVFMARDAGDRVSKDLWPQGAGQGIEIEVLDPSTGGKGWCYLLHFPESAPATCFPIRVTLDDSEELIGKGSTYTYVATNFTSGDRVYQTVTNKHTWVTPEGGGDGKDFVDLSKVRIEVRFLFGMIRIKISESSFIGEVSKYKIGPVRTVIRQWGGFKLPLSLHKLKSPKLNIDIYVYDTMMFTGVTTNMPFNPGYVVTDFRLSVGYDLHHPHGYGMRWYNSNNMEGFLADGVTSPLEAEYDDRSDKWRCIVGPNGWQMHSSTWDKEYIEQAEIKVHYRDDLESYSPPEYYPGDLAYYYTISTVKSMQPRKYKFQMDWYFPYGFYDPDGLRLDIVDQIESIKDEPLVIKVGSREVSNNAPSVSHVGP